MAPSHDLHANETVGLPQILTSLIGITSKWVLDGNVMGMEMGDELKVACGVVRHKKIIGYGTW